MKEYSKPYQIRWSDLDANGHVSYSAYINAAGDLRYAFFSERGFPPEKFQQLGIGPIYTAIHAQFFREVLLGETVALTYVRSGLSASGGWWKVHHNILKSNNKRAVSIDLEGGILDLTNRKPVLPTAELWPVFNLIPRAKDFVELPEARWKR